MGDTCNAAALEAAVAGGGFEFPPCTSVPVEHNFLSAVITTVRGRG